MRLVPSIASLGRKCTNALIKHGVMEKLCELLVAETMASTLRLLSLRALDGLLNYPQGVERFLGWDREEIVDDEAGEERLTPYQQVLELQLNTSSPRVSASVTALLHKTRVAELVSTLQESVDKVVAMTPVKPVEAPPSGDLFDLYGVEKKAGLEPECTEGASVPEQGELEPGEPKKLTPDSEVPIAQTEEEEGGEEEGGMACVPEGDKEREADMHC